MPLPSSLVWRNLQSVADELGLDLELHEMGPEQWRGVSFAARPALTRPQRRRLFRRCRQREQRNWVRGCLRVLELQREVLSARLHRGLCQLTTVSLMQCEDLGQATQPQELHETLQRTQRELRDLYADLPTGTQLPEWLARRGLNGWDDPTCAQRLLAEYLLWAGWLEPQLEVRPGPGGLRLNLSRSLAKKLRPLQQLLAMVGLQARWRHGFLVFRWA